MKKYENAFVKNLYATYGFMIKKTQLIEFHLVTLIVKDNVMKHKSRYKNKEDVVKDFNFFNKKTLGYLKNVLISKKLLSKEDKKELTNIVNIRNYLVHHFFKESIFTKRLENEANIIEATNKLDSFNDSLIIFNEKIEILSREAREELKDMIWRKR